MNAGSWLVLAVVMLIAALAIRSIIKNKKRGKSRNCGGCTGCSGGIVPPSCSAADDMVRRMEQSARQ